MESLVLRAGGDVAANRQVGEELLDLGSAQVARMPLVVDSALIMPPLSQE
jgi:hypothetical protein